MESSGAAVEPAAPAPSDAAPPKQATDESSSTTTTQQAPATSATPQRRAKIQPRDRWNHQSLGASLNSAVKQARVLMVGAGGIGCELLKNLVLTGFGEIHIVDLDTIDLSNLNRQFLFRHEHIKKSKALVAKDAAQRFNPSAKIVAHHANIKDLQFNVSWFAGFKLVFNALDNLDARRHVNKMCLAADIPLIDGGTTGFQGQVQVIKKGVTACYDCNPKETPKSYPVCTIRSTPSQPIHCVVWGKSYLLSEIFGASEDLSAFDHSEDSENASEIEELKKESDALKKIRNAIGTSEFKQMLFDKVFDADIVRLRSVADMWKSRRPPQALNYVDLTAKAGDATEGKQAVIADGQRVWSLEENLVVFNDSLDRLSARFIELKGDDKTNPEIVFDKDDEDTLDFVTASTNIRSFIFGIDCKSRFDIKQMAGNIIPAIATANAIVAGACVLQSFKVLKGDYAQVKEVFLGQFTSTKLLSPDRQSPPNPDCPVCGVFNTSVTIDSSRTTLEDIVSGLVKKHLGYGEKEFSLSNEVGVLYDPDEEDNLPKKLSDLGIKEGSFLTVMDDDDDAWVNAVINVEEGSLDDEKESFKASCPEKPKIPAKPKKQVTNELNGHATQNGKQNGDAILEVKSLKRSNPDDGDQPAKKAKKTDMRSEDVVVIEDDDGAFVIPDD